MHDNLVAGEKCSNAVAWYNVTKADIDFLESADESLILTTLLLVTVEIIVYKAWKH